MNNRFLISNVLKTIIVTAAALLSLTACHGISYVPRAKLASLPEVQKYAMPPSLNTLPHTEAKTIPTTGTRSNSDKPFKSISRMLGAIQFKNATEDESDDHFLVLKRRNSKFVAETILMDKPNQKSYFSVGGINGSNHAIGFQIRFEY